jgi:hypothetical protein
MRHKSIERKLKGFEVPRVLDHTHAGGIISMMNDFICGAFQRCQVSSQRHLLTRAY